MNVDPAPVLALVGDLYAQLADLKAQVTELETVNARLREELAIANESQ